MGTGGSFRRQSQEALRREFSKDMEVKEVNIEYIFKESSARKLGSVLLKEL